MKHNNLCLRGKGWWYDRLKRRYLEIFDHAIDACKSERRYRIDTITNSRIRNAITVTQGGFQTETTRAIVIPAVCAKGFIRVRWIPRGTTLGWQFAGDPAGALDALKRFIKRQGVGPVTQVTFTDFSTERQAICLARELDGPAVQSVISHWEKTRVR